MSTEIDWLPIKIESHKATGVMREKVEITWILNQTPEQEWTKAFQSAAVSRGGHMDYVFGPDPTVRASSVVWLIPEDAIEDANRNVQVRIDTANDSFVGTLHKRAREAAAKQERQAAEQQMLVKAQNRLDNLAR